MDEKVSVIIPTYNAENTIIRCLDSVRNQTYKKLEVIIINDGSTDRSLEIIEDYIRKFHLEEWYLLSQKNRGVSATRNEGILKSSGSYIAFLDSDDIWMSNKIEKQIDIISRKEVAIVGCEMKDIISSGVVKYTLHDMLIKNRLYTSSVMVKKSILLETSLFNENMTYSEDYRLWLEIASLYPVHVIKEHLINYEENSTSKRGLSSNLLEMEKGELSNFYHLLKKGKIGNLGYIFFSSYSIIKFIRRVIKSVYYSWFNYQSK